MSPRAARSRSGNRDGSAERERAGGDRQRAGHERRVRHGVVEGVRGPQQRPPAGRPRPAPRRRWPGPRRSAAPRRRAPPRPGRPSRWRRGSRRRCRSGSGRRARGSRRPSRPSAARRRPPRARASATALTMTSASARLITAVVCPLGYASGPMKWPAGYSRWTASSGFRICVVTPAPSITVKAAAAGAVALRHERGDDQRTRQHRERRRVEEADESRRSGSCPAGPTGP